jgi:hypothetical protein
VKPVIADPEEQTQAEEIPRHVYVPARYPNRYCITCGDVPDMPYHVRPGGAPRTDDA